MARDKEKLLEMLDPKSENFMGTGMTAEQFMLTGEAERIERSFYRQSREEKRRRMDLLMRLSVELTKIRAVDRFSTRLGEAAIEDIIEGDLVGLRGLASTFEMDEDLPGKEELRVLWSEFSRIVKEAIAGWPSDDPCDSQEVH